MAGARAGLSGARSGLFMEQVRLVKEMRNADEQRGRAGHAVRPRYMLWENLKNGRLDSDCDNVFIRHIHPYGEFQSSTTLSENLKRYMKYAGMTVKKRKAAHSLRHTLASSLLYDGTPLMTISNILGHNSPKTTSVYTKVDLPALRKCALSYGERRELI